MLQIFGRITLKSLPICLFRFSIFILETLKFKKKDDIVGNCLELNPTYVITAMDLKWMIEHWFVVTHNKHFRKCLRLSLWRKGSEIQNEIMRYVCEMNDTPTCRWLKRWSLQNWIKLGWMQDCSWGEGRVGMGRLPSRVAWNLEKNSKGPFPQFADVEIRKSFQISFIMNKNAITKSQRKTLEAGIITHRVSSQTFCEIINFPDVVPIQVENA